MKLFNFKPRLRCLFAISLLMMSCGKKPQNPQEQTRGGQQADPVTTDTEEFLNKQVVVCEEGEVCPDYMVKIVALENKQAKFCSGFLVNDNTVATSTSCLPKLVRLKGQDCSQDVSLFFPKTSKLAAERVACKKVLQVSELPGKNAVLWRDNVAFIELQKPLEDRRFLLVNRDGFQDKRSYTMWAIDQVDERTAFIRRQNCQPLHDSWVNPLASKETSPNMLFAGCKLKDGNTGAPILDARGRVRGVVSENLDLELRKHLESTGLLTDGLKDMFHATNFSCAPTPYDTRMEDLRECTKVVDENMLVKLRQTMLNREDLFEEKRKQIEEKVSAAIKFFNYRVRLISNGDQKLAEITPKCFKNVFTWVYGLDTSRGKFSFKAGIPLLAIKRTMDPDGKIGAIEVDNGHVDYWFQFSAKDLKKHRQSDLLVWNETTDTVIYKDLNENCK